jgi:hypothetical protein
LKGSCLPPHGRCKHDNSQLSVTHSCHYRGPTIGVDNDKGAGMHVPLVMCVFAQPSSRAVCGFAFFSLLRAMKRPSVTVRDENAGRATPQNSAVTGLKNSGGRRGMMTTRCIAMSVGKVSDGTQRDHSGHPPKLQPHLETKHVRKKRLFRERMQVLLSAVQCCSGNALRVSPGKCPPRGKVL